MAWVTPKTDWQQDDSINLDPDYARIRGNILHLHQMAKQLYADFPLRPMGDYSVAGVPVTELFQAPAAPEHQTFLPFCLAAPAPYRIATVPDAAFFASPDENTDALLDGTFRPPNAPRGRSYAENGAVWNAKDLNRIEGALLRLELNLRAQKNACARLSFILGGGTFGTFF